MVYLMLAKVQGFEQVWNKHSLRCLLCACALAIQTLFFFIYFSIFNYVFNFRAVLNI